MRISAISLTAFLIFSLIFISCSKKPQINLVDVTAKDYYFQMNDSIPSGWTQFHFINKGHATHFFYLTLLPDSITFQNYNGELVPAFVAAWDTLKAGATKADAGAVLMKQIPKWYASAKYMGGAGLIAKGKSEVDIIKLIPGNYVMECYVKTEDGKFHSELGMLRPVTVTNDISEMKEPENADLEINLYNTRLEVPEKVSSGEHTVAVHFKEQPKFGLGNDVHVVKLNEEADSTKIIKWMDWMNINGFRQPAPAGFLGGVQEMPEGNTAYFKVDLAPGKYAWITEGAENNVKFKEFTVD